jgi:hypothetical protein
MNRLESLINDLTKNYREFTIVIGGDFNISKEKLAKTPLGSLVKDQIKLNNVKNRHGNVIDYIFVINGNQSSTVKDLGTPGSSDHRALLTEINI